MVCSARPCVRKCEVQGMKLTKSKTTRRNLLTLACVIAAYAVMQILASAGALSRSLSGQLVPICVYIVMALSLNLVVGISGELSLGHAGFMSVGAFSGVIAVTALQDKIGSSVLLMLLGMLIGGILAGIVGALIGIPVLRLRGDYLAIVTLAFGEIIRNIFDCLYINIDDKGLHVSMFSGSDLPGQAIVAGPQGASVPARLSTFALGFGLVLVTLILIMNLVHSREGRAIRAIRDNNIAAESIGLNVTAFKMKAFVISAVLAGMAGVLFAMNYSAIEAKKFNFNTSISVLVMVVLGGMGSLRGSVIAAVVLTVLPEALRGLEDYRMLIYAIVLIAVMVLNNNLRFQQFKQAMKDRLSRVLRRIFRRKEAKA